jgi:hypothetical protein
MNQEQLLSDLQAFDSTKSDAAASALAEYRYQAAVPAILESIIRECGWEIVSERKIAAIVHLADLDSVPLMVGYLDRLDESDLEDDAGDVSDEFWRIQTAIERILIGIGSQVIEPVRAALNVTNNRFTKECLSEVLMELETAERDITR